MSPRLRHTLGVCAVSVLAAYLGSQIAEGEYALAALAATLIVAGVLVLLSRLSVDIVLLGLILFGYLVGNRGFAQLTPASGLPLFPAEIALGVAIVWRGFQGALRRELPFRRDDLNWAVLAWLVLGTARIVFDVPRFGVAALRDFATIYYAVFFFLAQDMARSPRARNYLIGCLLVGVFVLGPIFTLFTFFEDFFVTHFTVRGVPLIYYKGDLAATQFAVGSLLLFHWGRNRHRLWTWPASIGMFLFLLAFDSRAALVGGLVAAALLLLARRWHFPVLQAGVAALAIAGLLLLSTLFDNGWSNRKLDGLADRMSSLVDLTGSGRYQSEESNFKGGNNRFRYVWWKNVAIETWETNPVFGLGFGADLAGGFVQEYYSDSGEEFTARSPHSIVMTIVGRMGAVGLIVWLVFCTALLRHTWRSIRYTEDRVDWALWCGAWVILMSASFGVVLEGPMAAVIFWSMLGLANASPAAAGTQVAEPSAALPELAETAKSK